MAPVIECKGLQATADLNCLLGTRSVGVHITVVIVIIIIYAFAHLLKKNAWLLHLVGDKAQLAARTDHFIYFYFIY